ncbi:MAG TPA: Nif3-like dinuclear metal center hexameric protein [Williamwhitmania sp.]|nr:Nif3-like dinuclear metal center hexameric protein [Williamwhitmania sp.]
MESPTVAELASCIEEFAPLRLQESYDNSGLQVGSRSMVVNSVLLTVDITLEVIEEAIAKKVNMIIAHHPVIFTGLKRIAGDSEVEKIVYKAVKHDIALYASHTNLDSTAGGVSHKMAEKLGLTEISVLEPAESKLVKIVVYVPVIFVEKVRAAMFEAGAGSIGNYDSCSFTSHGEGTFRAGENANPFVGNVGQRHVEQEVRLELVCPEYQVQNVIAAMLGVHPYEEVAYDIYSLENKNTRVGLGVVGSLPQAIPPAEFLQLVKKVFGAECLRYTSPVKSSVQRVALCGGSGFSLLPKAIAAKADAYITADVKYHNFFDAKGKLLLVDIGHFESEQFSLEIISSLLKKKFANFAVYIAEKNSNPINYL